MGFLPYSLFRKTKTARILSRATRPVYDLRHTALLKVAKKENELSLVSWTDGVGGKTVA